MKTIVCLLLLFSLASSACAQADKELSTSDMPIDHVLARQLRMPTEVFRMGNSIRVYVYFTVTPEGTYTNVSIVNSNPVHESFHLEIAKSWCRLPRETADFAGDYVVPIAFMIGDGGPDKLKPIWNVADGITRDRSFKLLKEISVVSYIVCEKKSL